ncbi:MAG TPA: DUF4232 domain-containing protein [Acidimicrobiales bacterium]|nr:DUF4232 domain-containing protein [Acidimicrobiales bacterium]
MRKVQSFIAVVAVVGGVLVGAAGSMAAATATPSCKPTQMVVSRGSTNGAAGTIYHIIVFTNSAGTCAIWGTPAIQPVVGPSHRSVGPTAGNASMGQMAARHVLTKGMSVSVDYGVVETGNFSPASCRAKIADGVVVSLLPFVKSTYVKMSISVCTQRVSTKSRLLSPGRFG